VIDLKTPSLVMNSHDVPGPDYTGTYTWDVPEGVPLNNVVAMILGSNNRAYAEEKTYLKNVVINCHGWDGGGGLSIGGQGKAAITTQNVSAFEILKKLEVKIGALWLVACQAAYGDAGKALCKALALACNCTVVAGDDDQEVEASYSVPYYGIPIVGLIGGLVGGGGGLLLRRRIYKSTIDEYEGNVFRWDERGNQAKCDPHKDIPTAD